MKKLVSLILILLLCLAGWAGASYFISAKVEQNTTALMAQLSEKGLMEIRVEDYQRGLLGATFQTVIEVPLPQPAPTAAADNSSATPRVLRLTFASEVQHGPLFSGSAPGLALIQTRLVSMTPGDDELQKLFAQVPALKETLSVTRIDFFGTLHERFAIPTFSTRVEGAEFTWGGLFVNSHYSQGDKTLAGDFNLPQLQIRDAQLQLDWAGLEGNFDLNEALPLIYVGTTAITSKPFEMQFTNGQTNATQSLRMEVIKISSASSCDGKLVAVNQTMEIGGIQVEGETYGPGVCNIELKNLDGEVLGRFQGEVQQIIRNSAQTDPEQMLGPLLALYSQLMTQLLQQNPEINIRKLHFATPQGDIDASLRFSFNGNPQENQKTPAAMLQSIDAQAELALHETLLRQIATGLVLGQLEAARKVGQIPETFNDDDLATMAEQQVAPQIETLLAQNLAIRDGERLKSQATLQKGRLTVNGQELPLFR